MACAWGGPLAPVHVPGGWLIGDNPDTLAFMAEVLNFTWASWRLTDDMLTGPWRHKPPAR